MSQLQCVFSFVQPIKREEYIVTEFNPVAMIDMKI